MIIIPEQIFNALLGGLIIGLSASIMLIFIGRISGISGIFANGLNFKKNNLWRPFFVLGLMLGGFFCFKIKPELFYNSINYTPLRLIFSGILVGYGTQLGNGCTSGHGVCGISRLSKRSIVATLCFMTSGLITVYIFGSL